MSQVLFLELSVGPGLQPQALELLRALKAQLEARHDVRGAQLLHSVQSTDPDQPLHVFLLESKWLRTPPETLAGWPSNLAAKHRRWAFEVLEGAGVIETLTNWRRTRIAAPSLETAEHLGMGTTVKLETLQRHGYPNPFGSGYPVPATLAEPPVVTGPLPSSSSITQNSDGRAEGRKHTSTWTQPSAAKPGWFTPKYNTPGSTPAPLVSERKAMQPSQPMKVLQESTLVTMAEDMNKAQGVAVALLPRFGLEITIEGQQFQVNIAELQTGHDIRLSRDVAAGIQEAMRQLVEKIDAHLATQGPQA